jgi:hypothetical protein
LKRRREPGYQQRRHRRCFVDPRCRWYVANEDGDVFVLKAGPKYELLAKNSVGEPVLATPALAGDLLLVRGAKHLFAIAEAERK